MSRAVLSIGSNLGDPLANLQLAVDTVRPWLVGVSPVFATPPWGGVAQAEFRNAVLIADDPSASPRDWLDRAHEAERRAGRTRDVHWGPRTLDVDVITVEREGVSVLSDDPELTLPHPFAHERAFVLAPWWSLDPEASLPGRGSVLELLQALGEREVAAVRMLPGVVLAP